MRVKGIIDLLSAALIVGFILGFMSFIFEILANYYVQYKMYRIIVLSLQKTLNPYSVFYVSVVLILYVIFVFLGKKINLTEEKVLHFGILVIALSFIFLTVNLLLRIFTGYTVQVITRKLIVKLGDILTGKITLGFFFSQLKANTRTLIIIISSLIIGIMFFYFLLTKIKWGKILRIIRYKMKYIRMTGLVLVFFLVFLNLIILIINKMPEGPNVILIVVDTLRADHLGCYGYRKKISPNIDELSQDSVLFKNAYSPAPWTTPAMASIFTSQYPGVLGIEDQAVKTDLKFLTLAEVFKENNYKTKGIISNLFVSSKLGLNQGFDSYDEDDAKGHGYISSPSITEKAVSFLKGHKKDKFFLFIFYFDPHYDFIMHKNYNYYPDYNGPLYSGQPIEELWQKAPDMSVNDIEYVKALYDSEISFTDEYIGKFLEALKEYKLYNNSLIIFTADHGEEFCERGDRWIGHTKKLYQEQIKVPLIIKLPGYNKKKIINENVGLIDLMPTILDYIGLKISNEYEYEREIRNLWDASELENRKIISETERWATLQSVILRNWKFIYNPINSTRELYNLEIDPLESKNIATDNSKILNELELILHDWNKYIELKKLRLKTDKVQLPSFTEEQKERLKSLGYIE